MRNKGIRVLVMVALLLGMISSVVFAQTRYSEWIPARNYPNIYYQYANQFNSDEWDGVRFANQNPYRVKITVKFTYRPTGTDVGEREVYLEGGNTYSDIIQLGPNVEMSFMVEED